MHVTLAKLSPMVYVIFLLLITVSNGYGSVGMCLIRRILKKIILGVCFFPWSLNMLQSYFQS